MNKQDVVDLKKWAEITVQRWEMRIAQIGFGPTSTGAFINSFRNHVENDAGGDAEKISFTFLYYGYYWDQGVGKGYYRGNPGDLKSLDPWNGGEGHRKKHRWFNKIFWREFNQLGRLMAEQYGQQWVDEAMKAIQTLNFNGQHA